MPRAYDDEGAYEGKNDRIGAYEGQNEGNRPSKIF